MAKKMTNSLDKYRDFALEYVRTLNIQESAKKCGMSIRNAHRILKDPRVREFIDEELEKINSEKIADGKEVMEYLSSVMRGQLREQVAMTINVGDFMSEVALVNKEVGQKERLKAAELLGKVYGIYTPDINVDSNVQVVFENEENLED